MVVVMMMQELPSSVLKLDVSYNALSDLDGLQRLPGLTVLCLQVMINHHQSSSSSIIIIVICVMLITGQSTRLAGRHRAVPPLCSVLF